MRIGFIGRKVGMTQLFQADGTMIPVSVVSVEPNTVTRLRTPERDGYTAVQLGIEESGRLTKPEIGQLKNLPKLSVIREFRLDDAGTEAYTVGQKLDVTLFTAGDVVDVIGVSKGKGFAGHIKRHHFKRGPKTHGSDDHRAPGSIGPGTTPGRVYKGMRMAGHLGDTRATVKKLRVVRADAERNLLLVKGSVPGCPQRADPREEGLAMPKTTLYARTGEAIGEVELPEELFSAPVNVAVLHQVVTAQLAGRHLGTHDTKKRGEVSGGGKKPYRQKGTGRARQGSTRSPNYAGGGVVFGPHPRSYAQRLPRQMKRLALCGALTAKLDDDAIRIVDGIGLEGPRTRDLVEVLAALGRADGRVLIVAPGTDETLILSARNLPRVEVIRADSLNVVALLNADTVLIEQPALSKMEEVYA